MAINSRDLSGLRKQIRQACRQARNALSGTEQALAAEKLIVQVSELIKDHHTFALYLSNDGEIDPSQLMSWLWQNNKRTALPRMHAFRAGYLNFQVFQETSLLEKNQYGIREPGLNALETVPLEHIDVLFMPLVSFDQFGNRLGMGGGYYDRTLSRINELDTRPVLVGLAHDCQQSPQLPIESWDVPLDMIITPTKKIFIKDVELETPNSL